MRTSGRGRGRSGADASDRGAPPGASILRIRPFRDWIERRVQQVDLRRSSVWWGLDGVSRHPGAARTTKIFVVDPQGRRSRFLRGILMQSLQYSGLPFEDAYKVATDVREEIGDKAQINMRELRDRVLVYLRKNHRERDQAQLIQSRSSG